MGFVVNLGPLIALRMRREFGAVERGLDPTALPYNGIAISVILATPLNLGYADVDRPDSA